MSSSDDEAACPSTPNKSKGKKKSPPSCSPERSPCESLSAESAQSLAGDDSETLDAALGDSSPTEEGEAESPVATHAPEVALESSGSPRTPDPKHKKRKGRGCASGGNPTATHSAKAGGGKKEPSCGGDADLGRGTEGKNRAAQKGDTVQSGKANVDGVSAVGTESPSSPSSTRAKTKDTNGRQAHSQTESASTGATRSDAKELEGGMRIAKKKRSKTLIDKEMKARRIGMTQSDPIRARERQKKTRTKTKKPRSRKSSHVSDPSSGVDETAAAELVASMISSDAGGLQVVSEEEAPATPNGPAIALSDTSCSTLLSSTGSSSSELRRTTSLGDLVDLIEEFPLVKTSMAFSQNTNYKIKQQIARGESGIVYLVEHVETRQRYAAKVMAKATQEKHIATRIRPEYTLLSRLKHPNIVKVFQVIESDEDITLVTDFCNGQDLLHMMNEKKMDRMEEKLARELFAQIATAVKYMHEMSICHRDLKVENMLYVKAKKKGGTGLVVLGDFGCATIWDGDKWLMRDLGTLGYCSPEVLHPKRKYRGPEADIWSLGVVLYFMTTGRKPFKRPTKKATKMATMAGEFSLHAWMSSELMSLLRGMLKVDVADRFTMDDVLSHPWMAESRVLNDGLESVVGSPLHKSRKKSGAFTSKRKPLKFDSKSIRFSGRNKKKDQ